MKRLVYRIADAAEALATSPNTVMRLINEGEIEAYREGRNWSIPVALLEEYVITRAKNETKERRSK